MIGIDTNVLVRFLVNDEPTQAAAAKALIEGRANAGEAVFIDRVVLCETVWVLTGGYRYAPERVADMLDALLDADGFELESRADVADAIALWRGGGPGFTDALIGPMNRRHGCAVTMTFDRKAAPLSDFQLLT